MTGLDPHYLSRAQTLNTQNPDKGATPEPTSKTVSSHRLISKVLSPAVRLWLRSQVQQVSELAVKISGSDRQILSGYIPLVSISADNAVYQGLHLTQIQLVAENIRINLGQVLRGQPLRLLEPLPVSGELLLQEADINASLQAPILLEGLTEFLLTLLESGFSPEQSALLIDKQWRWQNPQIKLNAGQVTISATLLPLSGNPTPIVICTGFQLASSNELQMDKPQIQIGLGSPMTDLNGFKLDLGQEVAIEELTLTSGQLVCRGRINVMPTE